jgi:hypothetical protein
MAANLSGFRIPKLSTPKNSSAKAANSFSMGCSQQSAYVAKRTRHVSQGVSHCPPLAHRSQSSQNWAESPPTGRGGEDGNPCWTQWLGYPAW